MILPNTDHLSSYFEDITSECAVAPAPNGLATSRTADNASEQTELIDLVKQAQAGDLSAQSDLVRRFSRRIAGHVRSIIRQPDAVDDVTQIIFIKMVRRLSRLRDAAMFESWLFTLSRHASCDYIRARRRRPIATASEAELFEVSDPSQLNVTREIMDELALALAHVSPVDRRLMTRYVQGASYRDLAAQHGLSAAAVKVRLHRIRPFLRSRLRSIAESGLREVAQSRIMYTNFRRAA